MLVKNINDAILKKKQKKDGKSRKNSKKAEKPSKSRIFLLKAEEVATLVTVQSSTILFVLVDNFLKNSILYKKKFQNFRQNRRLFPQFFRLRDTPVMRIDK